MIFVFFRIHQRILSELGGLGGKIKALDFTLSPVLSAKTICLTSVNFSALNFRVYRLHIRKRYGCCVWHRSRAVTISSMLFVSYFLIDEMSDGKMDQYLGVSKKTRLYHECECKGTVWYICCRGQPAPGQPDSGRKTGAMPCARPLDLPASRFTSMKYGYR